MDTYAPAQQPDRLRQVVAVLAVAGSFIINLLSNLNPIGGRTIGDIANNELGGVLMTPANYAFIIWGLIYVGLIGFAVYQFLPNPHPQLRAITYWFLLATVAQGVWIYLFLLRQFSWSILAMLVLLVSLSAIFLNLHQPKGRSRQERWLLRYPFSVYLGWIAVATVVNVASALYAAGWDGWGVPPEIWTVAMLVVATLLATAMLWRYRNVPYALVAVWALVAIALRHLDIVMIAFTAWGLAALLLLLIVNQTLRPVRSSI